MTKNRPKNGSLNRDLLNFFHRYGIFWMPPGESSHPGGKDDQMDFQEDDDERVLL